nr:CoA ester lyase [Novosphingobium flavum]
MFVPGDRPERFAKAEASGADAVILDLEDSVSPAHRDHARAAVRKRLGEPRGPALLAVRINPPGSAAAAADLAALADGPAPGVIVVPKAEGAATLRDLSARLAGTGLAEAALLPIATETPRALFQLGTYRECRERLAGMAWGAEDLSAAIGAEASREADGRFTPPYEMARALALFAAAAAGVPAIETVWPAFADEAGLAAFAARAARDGFAGMLAIHPAQVSVINAAFTPGAERVDWARRVVAAFAAAPEAGALQLDGAMIDAPHLAQARRILARLGPQA